MSRISVERTRGRRRGTGGFTLTEVIIASSLAAIVLTAILAAYLYLGRNLTRLVNLQEQEVESRRALRYFTGDVSAALRVTTAAPWNLALTRPTAASTTDVSYVYSAQAGTLTRTDGTGTQTLLSGLTSFAFTYYNEGGNAISWSPQSVKAVEFLAASAAGSAVAGTQAKYTTASPRVVVRNKQILE